MLSNAFALAILTTGGFIAVYAKLPRKMRRLIEKYDVITDIIVLLATYWFLGGTLTALVAGAIVGLIVSGLLHIAKNPDDFLYLYAFKNAVKKKLSEANQALKEFGKSYKDKHCTVE